MQRKKSATGEKSAEESASAAPGETAARAGTEAGGKVGRPPTSPFDRKTQVRENVRAHRAKLKASGLEKVETYLPKEWVRFLRDANEPIQQLGLEAFTLLLQKRGAMALVEAAKVSMIPSEED